MRRARIALALVTLALAFCAPGISRGAVGTTKLTGLGILDFTHKPTFKVGDYVRYSVTTYDQFGEVGDHYWMTVLIAGQDVWWGERCFYLETWVETEQRVKSVAASLISYSIFDDSLPTEHLQDYMRKAVMGVDPDENKFQELLITPKPTSLTSRSTLSRPRSMQRDTLGPDTVMTPMGVMRALKLRTHQAFGNTGGAGDSSIYKELREDHTIWRSDDVPLTRSARDLSETSETRRAWLIGRSTEGTPPSLVGKATVDARVVEFGHGLKSRALPPDRVHSFDEAPAAPKKPAAKPGTPSGAARRRP